MQKRNLSKSSLFLLLAILFGFYACKTDPNNGNEKPEITKSSTVTVRLRAEADRLNPLLSWYGWSIHIMNFIFPTLLAYNPETEELSPVLVKSRPEVIPITEGPYDGGTKYSYELLEEATWENGTPLTAKDYEFTLKVLFNPHVACEVYRQILSLIRDVELDPENPRKYAVLTDEKYIKAEHATGLFILPEYVYDPEGLLKDYKVGDLTDPAQAEKHAADENLKTFGEQFNSSKYSREKEYVSGAGAYKLDEWVSGERIVIVKKKNWWGDKLRDQNPLLTAYPEKMIFMPIADPNTAISMLKDQSIDVMDAIPEIQFLELKENELVNQHYNFYAPDILGFYLLYLNTRIPKLEDKRVRRALAHLFDVEEVLKSVKLDFGVPIVGPVHPTRSYYNKNLKPIELDVEKARTLLKEAGWEDSNSNGTVDKNIDGELLEMNLQYMITPNNPTSNNIALIFKNEARKAGVNIEIITKEANVLRQDVKKRDFELFAGGAHQDMVDDPKQFWHTSSDTPNGSNRCGFGDAESDQLIEEIRRTLDEEKRGKLFLRLQEIIYEEQPAIFMYATKDRVAIHNRFKGVKLSLVSPRYFENYWYE